MPATSILSLRLRVILTRTQSLSLTLSPTLSLAVNLPLRAAKEPGLELLVNSDFNLKFKLPATVSLFSTQAAAGTWPGQ